MGNGERTVIMDLGPMADEPVFAGHVTQPWNLSGMA